MNHKLFKISVLSASCICLFINAQLRIEVTEGAKDPIRIAVAPVGWNVGSPASHYIHRIVSSDLSSFGEFEAIGTEEMLSLPKSEEEVFYRDWSILRVDYLIVGSASQTDRRGYLELNYSILDIVRRRAVHRARVVGKETELEALAHNMSDRIYKEINGISGIFSTRIAYINREGISEGNYYLRFCDVNGNNDQIVLTSKEPIMSPDWSPDGTKLAYVSFEEGTSRIYIQDLLSGKRKGLRLEKGINSSPTWSPKKEELIAVLSKKGNPDIYKYDFTRDRWNQLTFHYGIDTEPDWSPKGDKFLFTSNRSGSPQIYEMNISKNTIRRKTFIGDYNARARYTPDGKSFVFVHRKNGDFHIAVQNIKTNKIKILTNTQLDESPTVSPNGNLVLYATKNGTKDILSGITIDGKTKFSLPTISGEVRDPSWSPLFK
tara:strand:+ start:206 stop:1501 length:1296 start_codon:yes stop_codon:yes gene_type:complete